METEQMMMMMEDDGGGIMLPWGAALIPDWWTEVTPHHTLSTAYDEIDHDRRQEAARLATMRMEWSKSPAGSVEADAIAQSGEWMMDTASGPYSSLPGFSGSDGIHDASFVGPGSIKWHITGEGFFYDEEENPDAKYSAAQMVESGHLPPGMDAFFVPGWDRSNSKGAAGASTPSDTRIYARTEASAWERPDWLQKKLRSTNQGVALRHGVDGRAVSPGPRRRLEDDEYSGSAQEILPSPKRAVATATAVPATPPPSSAKPEWKRRQEEMAASKAASNSTSPQATTAAASANAVRMGTPTKVPEWKRKHDEIAKKHGEPTVLEVQGHQGSVSASTPTTTSKPASFSSWMKKKSPEEEAVANPATSPSGVPAWKKKQIETAAVVSASSSSNVPAWKKKQADAAVVSASSSSVPAWKKKQSDSAVVSTSTSTSNSVPAWKQSQPPTNNAKATSIVPAWKKPQTSTPSSSTVAAPPAWKKPHLTVPTQQPQSAVVSTVAPSWKQRQQDAAAATTPVASGPPTNTKLNLPAKAVLPTSMQSVISTTPAPPQTPPAAAQQQDNTVKSQQVVLHLINLGDDAARAKELRNNIAPVAENNHTVIVTPAQLLEAIAYHAQAFKKDSTNGNNNKTQMDALRQVAIIARLVIMKLYGSESSELKLFEDGLRPAFS